MLTLAALCAFTGPAPAADAGWLASPADSDFNNAANWDTGVVPDGTATFDASSTPNISFSANTTVGGWTFAPGAEAYGFSVGGGQTLAFTGAGIVVDGGSATITNNGSIFFISTSTSGDATIVNNSGSTISFHHIATAGNASITTNPGSTVVFNDSSTAGNASILNGSTSLVFRNSSSAVTADITTANGAVTSFLDTASGGNARFITQSGGTLNLSGLSSGGTTAGSIEGEGNFILGDKNLEVGSDDLSTTVSGVISGVNGSLTKTGNGTLNLTGSNTYTGATDVDAGILRVNGSLASSLTTVHSGAALGGNGTLRDTTISGTLAPGNSTGTLTVSGALTFAPGSTYAVELSSGGSDRTNVTGVATLDGTAHALFQPGAHLQHDYTILSAAGGLGGSTFDSLATTSLPSGFAASLDYVGNDVLLTLTATGIVPQNGGEIGQNQQGAVTAITDHFNDGGSLPPGFVTVLGLSGGELETALSQISGEAAAAAQAGATQASTQFLGAMFAPRAGSAVNSSFSFSLAPTTQAAVPIAYAAGEGGYTGSRPRWSTWVSSFGGGSEIDGDAATGSHDLSASAYGFAMGVDYQASRKTVLGLAFSGGSTSWNLSEDMGGGTSRDYQLGLNGAMRWEKIYAMAALAYGFHQMSTERAVPGGDLLTAGFDAQSLSGRIESGARFDTRTGSFITPYAALQAQAYLVPDYGEDDPGGSGFALSYGERLSTSTRAEFGARFEHALNIGEATRLNLGARLAYAHDWIGDPALTASFQSLPGASFTVNGAAPPTDIGLASLGAELILDKNLSLLARYEGAFAPGATSSAGIGTIRYSW